MAGPAFNVAATSTETAISLSLVIPLYRESQRLTRHEGDYSEWLDLHPGSELLLVDDGSEESEGTARIASAMAKADPRVRLLQLPEHRGKGAACRAGVAAARGQIVLLSDCDLSTPLAEYDRLAPLLEQCDLVIGSRHSADSQVTRKQPVWRRIGGYLGNLAVRRLLGLTWRDTQCGFKLLGPACKPLVATTACDGAGFDFELLALAERAELKVLERGVEWANSGDSRFGPRSFLHASRELLALRRRLR